MILEVDITVYKGKSSDAFYVNGILAENQSSLTVQSIEIKLGRSCRFSVDIQRPINFRKFRRESERIIREVNKNLTGLRFTRSSEYIMAWRTFDYEEIHYNLMISSSDLNRVKFSGEQRKIVRNALNGEMKINHNPSKPKPEMEYRKRYYHGKCKK